MFWDGFFMLWAGSGCSGVGNRVLPTLAKFSRFSAVFECWERKRSTAVGENVHWHLTKELVQYFNTASYFKQDDNSDKRKWILAAHKNQVRTSLAMPANVKKTSLYQMGVSAVTTCIFIKEIKD